MVNAKAIAKTIYPENGTYILKNNAVESSKMDHGEWPVDEYNTRNI